jgi:hypothetical protein
MIVGFDLVFQLYIPFAMVGEHITCGQRKYIEEADDIQNTVSD